MSRATDMAERLPWVKRLKDPVPCQGVKWSTVALRDLYVMHGKQPRGIQERSRCKNRAGWRFTALKRSSAKSGDYCWAHLLSAGLAHDPQEDERTRRWFARNGVS